MAINHPMVNIAVKAARRAGRIINQAAGNLDVLTVRHKSLNDLVSEVDRASEAAIIETIHGAYPEHAILAEESGATGKSDYLWIIDPLDGTTNFIHGFPQYCVSVAVQHRGATVHGVIYDPTRNELFTASKGSGAFLDDRRIRVGKCAQLGDALVGTGFPFKELSRIDAYVRQMKAVMQGSAGIRRAGAAALDLAYVAAGRLDAFWEMGLAPWDMAAGALMIQEAGGLVGDLAGEAGYLASGDIAAATPKVFPQLLAALKA
jgi:myo-inositol-1(or 4)-monophosphatase